MIGTTLGHFRILEKLGAGGMGEVYRARDERLQRDVALKILSAATLGDDAARRRLLREAETASSLNHAHICTIHEVGEDGGQAYIVMEHVEGRLLKELIPAGGLPAEAALRYGAQIADALAHAHERGIIHRDLKTLNVVITPAGQVKVLDFGLAKRLSGSEVDEATRSQKSLTEAGAIVGTLTYMAPEVLRGEPEDARSDIWALGVVLYEMAAGQMPFRGQTGFELSSAILREPPGPLPTGVPSGLRAIIQRCLAKEPGQRYQRAGEVRAALEAIEPAAPSAAAPATQAAAAQPQAVAGRTRRGWIWLGGVVAVAGVLVVAFALNIGGLRGRLLSPAPRAQIQSLAVIPLTNFSGDPEQEYFADGMTEALITDLSKIGALRVISRTSVMPYKATKKSLPEIARELNVDGVIEGSVQRSGERVRITAQLIHAPTDTHLWAQSYERELRDILTLEDEVARAIAGEVKVKLTPQAEARLTGAHPVDPEAHDAYLKGRFFWNQRTPEALNKALEYFGRALERDPAYAPAYAGIADTYYLLPSISEVPPKEVWPKAREATRKALELDDSLAEAHTSLAFLKCYQDWDWAGAEEEFRRAIELNPNYSTARLWYGRCLLALARFDEAITQMKRALESDPLSQVIRGQLGSAFYLWRRYDQVIEECQKALEISPNYPEAHLLLGSAYREKQRYPEAIAELEEAVKLSHGNARILATLAYTEAVSGDKREARRILEQLQRQAKQHYLSPFHIAMVYVGLGERNQAFESLDKAYEEHSEFLIFLNLTPVFDPLHSDPRFRNLVRRMGLSPAN